MFRRIGPNAAASSEGFTVARTARMELTYTEPSRSLKVEVEPGDGLAVYIESIKYWNDGADVVTADERRRVIRNISAGLEFLGEKYFLH